MTETVTFCTIASIRYYPMALVALESAMALHPGSRGYLLRIGDGEWGKAPQNVKFLTEGDVGAKFSRDYSLFEKSCGLKPYLIRTTAGHSDTRVVYIDADIFMLSPVKEAIAMADEYPVVLTPHLYRPLLFRTSVDQECLKYGCLNAGFMVISPDTRSESFLSWWAERLGDQCREALKAGLYVDQRWLDLAMAVFPFIGIIRIPGYNVARWNIHEDRPEWRNGNLNFGTFPVRFFHFSSFLWHGDVQSYLQRYNKVPDDDLRAWMKLAELYLDRLRDAEIRTGISLAENGVSRIQQFLHRIASTRRFFPSK